MWLLTSRGFYSIAAQPTDPDALLVRSRCFADITGLNGLLPGRPVPISSADYSWQIEATRTDWARAVAILLTDVTYLSFKHALRDSHQQEIYMGVWRQLLVVSDT